MDYNSDKHFSTPGAFLGGKIQPKEVRTVIRVERLEPGHSFEARLDKIGRSFGDKMRHRITDLKFATKRKPEAKTPGRKPGTRGYIRIKSAPASGDQKEPISVQLSETFKAIEERAAVLRCPEHIQALGKLTGDQVLKLLRQDSDMSESAARLSDFIEDVLKDEDDTA